VAVCVLVALGLLGAWLWTAWNRWWFDADEAQRRQAEAARQLGLPVEKTVDLGDGVKLELVLVPAGRFRMGVQAGEDDDQKTGYQWVRITKSFQMGKYEVTQEQWEKVMGTNPSNFKGAKNPVENVSWDDCQEFLKKLNALPHPNPLPPGEGARVRDLFRLPTEAEWEWACRAGTRTRFGFGDEESGLAEYGWYGGNSGKTTHPVGAKKPNVWGLHDMHGNVCEWCADADEEYVYGWWPKADPTGPGFDDYRVLRGGAWDHVAGHCRSACRGSNEPGIRSVSYGFRLVVSLSRTP
jgi:formylglycine-generating enzyme required for sulfatase activity